MILTADYHTHTPYSHGKNSVDENVRAAKEVGLQKVAISDHGFSHVVFGLRRVKVQQYVKECQAAAEKYGIEVLVGQESNIRGEDGKADLTEKDYETFDVYLCGQHVFIWYDTFADWVKFGLGNIFSRAFDKVTPEWIKKMNTTAYINAIKKNPIDAITHLNYTCPCDTLEVAKVAADYGTYIELNSKKMHLSDEQLAEIVAKTDARFIVNSDAHWSSRVGDTKLVEEQIARLGAFPMDRIDNIDGRFPNFRFTEYKKRM